MKFIIIKKRVINSQPYESLFLQSLCNLLRIQRIKNSLYHKSKMSQQITDSYTIDILQLLKNLAFHQLFMQKTRQQLADNPHFDPFTAFKLIDQFKHNMIISVELHSFLQLQGYDVLIGECQQCIKSLNKAEDSLNYDRFVQMVMPYDLRRRNMSMTRYNKMEVGIGTYKLVSQVKATSRQLIGKFFIKQIQFIRQLTSQRQYFCQKWGGDIYTISQLMFKTKSSQRQLSSSLSIDIDVDKQIGFQEFYDFCRQYKCYFNGQQFKGIWRRIKVVEEKIVLKPEQIRIKQRDMINLLLVKNFNTKLKYASKYDIPLNRMGLPPPSYKLPIPNDMIHDSMKYRAQQEQRGFENKLQGIRRQVNDPLTYGMKTYRSYPELQFNTVCPMLRQKQQQWKDTFSKMSDYMIDERYRKILQHQKATSLRWRR